MANNLTTEKKLELLQEISSLADGVTLEYVKSLSEIIKDPDTKVSEKRKAFSEMDKVLRVAKQYSDRLLLAEGKTTANIGNGGFMPCPQLMTEEELIRLLRVPEISTSGNYSNVIANLKRMHDLPRLHICGKTLYPAREIAKWISEKCSTGK